LPLLDQPLAVAEAPAWAPVRTIDERLAAITESTPSEPAALAPAALAPAAVSLATLSPPATAAVEVEVANIVEPANTNDTPPANEPTLASLPATRPTAPTPPKNDEPPAAAPGAQQPAAQWWPVPHRLLRQLDALAQQPAVAPWAARAAALLRELVASGSPADGRADEILVELRSLASGPGNFLAAPPLAAVQAELNDARFGLVRRLDIWQRVVEDQLRTAETAAADRDPQRLALCVAQVEGQTPQDEAGAAWREYLLLDAIKQLAEIRSEDQQRELARSALSRWNDAHLSASQREFLSSAPLRELRTELHAWATEPVDLRKLVEHLEQFEETGHSSHARLLAGDFNRLAWSTRAADETLAYWLDTDYRNANLRLSLSPEFLNRMVPPQQSRKARVRDLFLGHPTEGWSNTDTRIGFRLIPDPSRLHVALEARGQTSSEADTSDGPVQLHTHSDSEFVGWKEVMLGADGVQAAPARAEADSSPHLRWVKSDLDFIPIVGSLVCDIARSQHEDSQAEVRNLSRRKIRREVTEQIDSQLTPRIALANDRLQQRIIDPLEGLGLEAELIEARTTADRLTTRLRVASDEQLAGIGPRPRAPAGCLASIQMHQSLLNNICQRLGWEGQTFTLAALREEAAKKLHLELGPPPANLPRDLTVTFAAEDAIHVVCDNGQLQLNLAFARLQKPPESFRDFVIRVYYKPDSNSTNGRLVRNGTVQLIGGRLRPKAQLALRGIFSKAFPPSRSMQIIPEGIKSRPGLADLQVTQFEIRDGWIGVAFDRPEHGQADESVARQAADNR
jgi:hypothetical protein